MTESIQFQSSLVFFFFFLREVMKSKIIIILSKIKLFLTAVAPTLIIFVIEGLEFCRPSQPLCTLMM